jgi:hypothetical protein
MLSGKFNNNKVNPQVLKRSNRCKRKAIMTWMKYVDRRISSNNLAGFIGISCPTIINVRKKLTTQERKSKGKKFIKAKKKGKKRSALSAEIKKEIADLKFEIELKYQRQWNVAVKEEILDRLGELYTWVENDLHEEGVINV